MEIKILRIAFIAAIAVFTFIAQPRLMERDMRLCQLSHSHDVCFQQLNR